MRLTFHTSIEKVFENNISYYNQVAGTYNAIMAEQETNNFVRDFVKTKFCDEVEDGLVLDFGGGTGLDLPWLTERYGVIFCEPSDGMRERAIRMIEQKLPDSNVNVLESAKADFTSWIKDPPFATQVNAIIANFGVLNYIPDLKLLFENLASVLKPNGHFIMLVLELNLKQRWKWHRRNALKSLLFRRPFTMYIPFKDQKQMIFVHTPHEIKECCADHFRCCSIESLKEHDFTLIHLVRK